MKSTSYKKVFKQCSANLCDAIVSFEQPGINPTFGECVEISFSEEQNKSTTVLTKQGAKHLYEALKHILEEAEQKSSL